MLKSLPKHGRLLFVVGQPATIGALPVTVGQAEGLEVGYPPGLAMRRIADLHLGEAKNRRARCPEHSFDGPHHAPYAALRGDHDKQIAELSMPCGFRDDLTKEGTASSHRLQGRLTHIHPALERVIGQHLDHPAILELLAK